MKLFNCSVVLGFALMAGCSYHDALPKKKPLPAPVTPIRTNTDVAETRFCVTDEVSTKIRVGFITSGSENTFCQKLIERLSGEILPDYAEFTSGRISEIKIVLQPEFELIDSSGEYQRIRCNQVTAEIIFNGEKCASKVIEPKDLPRQLGLRKAKDQYLTPVLRELVPFLKKELNRLSNQEVAVSEIGFQLANLQERADGKHVARQIENVNRLLSKTSGILNYTLLRQDTSNATCTFRIVYLKKNFPIGLTNYLSLNLGKK